MIFSYIASFIAMILAGSSYFVKKKAFYLLLQLGTLVFLVLSYFFSASYVPMIALTVAILRVITFYLYEKKNKVAPIYVAFILSILTIIACFVVKYVNKQSILFIDIVYIVSCIAYIFVFRLRNLKLVRFTILFPLILSIIYNSVVFTTPFIIVSYSFELLANVVSIFKYHVFNQNKGGVTNETN